LNVDELQQNGVNDQAVKRMIYVPISNNYNEQNYALAYELELITTSLQNGYRLYISVESGEVLIAEPLELECHTPIQGETSNGPVQFVDFHGDDDLGNGSLRLFACENEADIHTRSAPLFATSVDNFYADSEEIRARLIYAGESGAISEAWSDLLSVDAESHMEGVEHEWHIGDGIPLFTGRNMKDPNTTFHPDCYKKEPFWKETDCMPNSDNDFCGVHTNSAIGNKWFHVLTDGDSGNNGCGEKYNVTGIGIDKAKDIAFHAILK